jgi:hypothetical protein
VLVPLYFHRESSPRNILYHDNLSNLRDATESRNDLAVPSSLYCGTYAQGGQGPPPMLQERFQNVISQLFQHVKFSSIVFLCLVGYLLGCCFYVFSSS